LQALSRNRMRSALTVLGIVIGVAAVIATLAIGQGAREAVQAQIRALGANTLTVLPGTITASGARSGMGSTTTMTPEDADAIRAVGVLTAKGGQGFGGNQDDIVIVPVTTAQRRLMGITYINAISVSAVSESQVDLAVDQITDLLKQRHRIRPGADPDFFLFTQKEIATSAAATSQVMTSLLASIAAVSLLVGGIGIMNIMLVSV